MEQADGGDVCDKVLSKKKFSEIDAKKIIHDALKGLNFLHHKNIIHRDLKPENLMIQLKKDENGKPIKDTIACIKLIDFGFSKMLDNELESLNTACGSPNYVAPEVL